MQAILHGKADASKTGRGVPPKSVASKYTAPEKDSPENSGENRGGTWGEGHHAKAKKKTQEARIERKKNKKKLKKSYEDFYKGQAAAVIVMDDNNRFLLGRHRTGGLAFAGGHYDAADGSTEITALRELKEEMGITGHNPHKIWNGKLNGNNCDVYLIESFTGEPKSTEEVKNPKWFDVEDIPWEDLRDCCLEPLKHFVTTKLGKSLRGMVSLERLEKNIIRQKADAVLEVSHGDALRLVGNGLFRVLRNAVKGMTDEDFKDVKIDTYTLSVRKHMNDIYSGRVNDGHKIVYQFTNKSLPEMTAALMSVFEWYLPEDEKELEILDEGLLHDDMIHGGINHLVDNYKRHNIGNIYQEMETIRENIRNGMAVDLQQVEARIMSLFDKLETVVHDASSKHNKLSEMVGSDIDELEGKLRDLQSKIEEMGKTPNVVEAFSAKPANHHAVHDENYPYLPKPQVEISPNGKIKITFNSDWTDLEKQNFLQDLRAKAIKRSSNG